MNLADATAVARTLSHAERVGRFFLVKFRHRVLDSGPAVVAAQLKKQGVDLETALLLIFGIEERFTCMRPC